jgi:predicted transposase/invertase (TIGR01784 family)
VYHLANKKSHKALTNLLEVHTIELKKLPKKGDGTLLGNWIRFLKSKTDEEFRMVAQTDLMIKKAVDLLEQLSQDKELRAEARQRAKALSDFNTSMSEARNEGMKLGEERGIQKERKRSKQDKQRFAHNLKQENVPLQSIADALGLTLEEVEAL